MAPADVARWGQRSALVLAEHEEIAREAASRRQEAAREGDVETEQASPDPHLIKLVRDANRWLEDQRTGSAESLADIARRSGVDAAVVSRTIGLAILAPDIVRTIMDGRQPPALTAERLRQAVPLPLGWSEQAERLGQSRR
ncbi:hypothetical protein DLJ53_09055 [Acuticoccus sediminis]|uniref:Uncharacterized protein n=1 Tax=Acuticoccus sediminis TaxID=2184697 RepID=A0A8B2NW08_9HYPH|nr:hypothetical protein [Acuticoccus sediminis]RAI01562.1 hypothetical protein DLJ53_09055 [Acuticoccus sediminis]